MVIACTVYINTAVATYPPSTSVVFILAYVYLNSLHSLHQHCSSYLPSLYVSGVHPGVCVPLRLCKDILGEDENILRGMQNRKKKT
jgi:hypothetical protein